MSVANEPPSVPALNLKAQYQSIRDEIEPVVRQVLESQMFVLGPEVSALEAEIAQYCGATAGIGCASGSDALCCHLMALDIGPGDEVITTPYTFFATAGAIWRTGARPVFVDIEPDTYNIDPAQIEAAITRADRAIIPVHLYGQTAEMGRSCRSPGRTGWPSWKTRRRPSAQRTMVPGPERWATWPRSASTLQEPGRVRRRRHDHDSRASLARRMARLRVHGMEPKYHHHEVGFNSRLDALQAAVLRVKFRHLDAWTDASPAGCGPVPRPFRLMRSRQSGRASVEPPGQLPRVQPVCHSRAGPASRPAPRSSFEQEDRHRDLLSDPAAPAGVLRIAGLQRGRLPSCRSRGERDHRASSLPRAYSGRAKPRRQLDPPVREGVRLSCPDHGSSGVRDRNGARAYC